jgi:hypothetical protein
VIFMVFGDHSPPHFHVRYGEHKGVFSIHELRLLNGNLPPKAVAMVLEWAFLHRDELLANWDLCVNHSYPKAIAPL